MDILRTYLDFLQVNVTSYDAVSIIHDVIITPYPNPYTDKFVFVVVWNYKKLTNETVKDIKDLS